MELRRADHLGSMMFRNYISNYNKCFSTSASTSSQGSQMFARQMFARQIIPDYCKPLLLLHEGAFAGEKSNRHLLS